MNDAHLQCKPFSYIGTTWTQILMQLSSQEQTVQNTAYVLFVISAIFGFLVCLLAKERRKWWKISLE
jgi:hypothetical protein